MIWREFIRATSDALSIYFRVFGSLAGSMNYSASSLPLFGGEVGDTAHAVCGRSNSMTVVITLTLTGFLLFLTFVIGVWRMTLAVMLVRPSCDKIFGWLAFGQQHGPGQAVNALVIVMAIIAVAHVPGVALVAPLLAWMGFLLAAAASLREPPDPSG